MIDSKMVTWARDNGYLFCDGIEDDWLEGEDPCPPGGCGWVDDIDEQVDIVALYEAAGAEHG